MADKDQKLSIFRSDSLIKCYEDIMLSVKSKKQKGEITWPDDMLKKMKEKQCVENLIKFYERDYEDSPFFFKNEKSILKWVTFFCEIQDPHDNKSIDELEEHRRPGYVINEDQKYVKMVKDIDCRRKEIYKEMDTTSILTSTIICETIAKYLSSFENENGKDETDLILEEFLDYPWIFRLPFESENNNNLQTNKNCSDMGCCPAEPVVCWATNGEKIFICSSNYPKDKLYGCKSRVIELIKSRKKLDFNEEDDIAEALQKFTDMCFYFKAYNKNGEVSKDYSGWLSHYVRLPITGMSFAKAEIDLAIKMEENSESVTELTRKLASSIRPLKTVLALIPTAIISEFSFKYAPLAVATAAARSQEWKAIAGNIAHSIQNLLGHPQSLIGEIYRNAALVRKELQNKADQTGKIILSKQDLRYDVNSVALLASSAASGIEDISLGLDIVGRRIKLMFTSAREGDIKVDRYLEKEETNLLLLILKCLARMGLAYTMHRHFDKRAQVKFSENQQDPILKTKAYITLKENGNDIQKISNPVEIPLNIAMWKLEEDMLSELSGDSLKIKYLHKDAIEALIEEYFYNFLKYGVKDTLHIEGNFDTTARMLKIYLTNKVSDHKDDKSEGRGMGEQAQKFICLDVLSAPKDKFRMGFCENDRNQYELLVEFPIKSLEK